MLSSHPSLGLSVFFLSFCANAGPRLVDKNALSARGGGPSRQSRSPSPDSPPAKQAGLLRRLLPSSGYDTDLPDEVQQDAYTVLST